MCRTIQSFGTTIICLLQMVIRIMMTTLLMAENLIRLILQTIYNLLSFIFQLCSLIPICLVFALTSKLKFLFCSGGGSGGGGCPGQRGGGSCDCIISALAVILIIYIFKATGVLDKILNKLGYQPKDQKKSFLRTNEEIEHLVRNGTEDNYLPSGRAHDFEDKLGLKLDDYEDTTAAPTSIVADVSAIGNISSTFPANLTTVYYYLV